jgi:hypothetical protein
MGKPEGKRPLELLVVTGWIILKCILRRYNLRAWFGFVSLREGVY